MLLANDDILNEGESYTFTYEHGSVKGHLDSWVQEKLAFYLSNFGTVTNASSNWFGGRYAVTVVPKNYWTLSAWKGGFDYAWQNMGYTGTFIQAEGGSVSHAAGGIHQLVTDTVKGVANTLGEAASGGLGAIAKQLAPWIALVVAGFLIYEYTKPKRGE